MVVLEAEPCTIRRPTVQLAARQHRTGRRLDILFCRVLFCVCTGCAVCEDSTPFLLREFGVMANTSHSRRLAVQVRQLPPIINLIFNLMATIRETILKVKPGKQKIIPLSDIDVMGYRQEAFRINKELKEKGISAPNGRPAYTISKNKYTNSLYILNNLKV